MPNWELHPELDDLRKRLVRVEDTQRDILKAQESILELLTEFARVLRALEDDEHANGDEPLSIEDQHQAFMIKQGLQ